MQKFRYVILLLAVLAAGVDYLARVNINVAIVSMVIPTTPPQNASRGSDVNYCGTSAVGNRSSAGAGSGTGLGPKFAWTAQEQGIVLGAFSLP